MKLLKFISLIILWIVPAKVTNAQSMFTEGILRYSVRMYKPTDNSIVQKGSFIISAKGNAIRKELKLNDGFQHIIINNGKEVYALQEVDRQKLAINLSLAQLELEQKEYKNWVATPQNETRTIAELKCTKNTVKYKHGTNNEVWFSNELTLSNKHIFERFPDTELLPVVFTYSQSDGINVAFTLEEYIITPVANSIFQIPKGYKMISSQEYKRLSE